MSYIFNRSFFSVPEIAFGLVQVSKEVTTGKSDNC
jgi:hypothetical protein